MNSDSGKKQKTNQPFLCAIALYSWSQAGGEPTLIIDRDGRQSSQEGPSVPQSHRVADAGGRFLPSPCEPMACQEANGARGKFSAKMVNIQQETIFKDPLEEAESHGQA